jgi:hypothetical protein
VKRAVIVVGGPDPDIRRRQQIRDVVTWCRETGIPVLCLRYMFRVDGPQRWGSRRFLSGDQSVSRNLRIREIDYALLRIRFGDMIKRA